MSVNTLETALYAIVMDRAVRTAFKVDPTEALGAYPLAAEERADIVAMNLHGLLGAGVNPMLLQGYWMVMKGPASLAELASALNGGGDLG